MSARMFGALMKILTVVLGVLVAVSVVLQLPIFVPLIGMMVVLLIANASRRYVKEVMDDERSRRIDEKATSVSYRIYVGGTAIVSLVVLMLKGSLPGWAAIVGYTLAFSVCALMLVHLASTSYYRRRL